MATTHVPVLETKRLKLREHRESDLERSFAMWSAADTVQFIGGTPSTLQRAWLRILEYRGMWAVKGFGYWAVEEASSGLYIGDVGFADFKRGVGPRFDKYPELGWALISSHRGQGFATEALTAALAWGDENFPKLAVTREADRTVCMINTANQPSHRVAEKIGLKNVGRSEQGTHEVFLYERPFRS